MSFQDCLIPKSAQQHSKISVSGLKTGGCKPPLKILSTYCLISAFTETGMISVTGTREGTRDSDSGITFVLV